MLSAIVPYPWYAPGLSGISLSVDCPLQITPHHPCWVGLCKGWREKETGGFSPISSKSGYYTVDCLPTVGALCEQAYQQLFTALKYNPIHPLHRLLPPECSTSPVLITMSSPSKLLVFRNVILYIAYLQRLFLASLPLYLWFYWTITVHF